MTQISWAVADRLLVGFRKQIDNRTVVYPDAGEENLSSAIILDPVALELYKAFSRSKELRGGLFFLVEELAIQQAAIFCGDPYPLGIRANAKMLNVLMQASFKEGLTKKLARVDEVFYLTTLDT